MAFGKKKKDEFATMAEIIQQNPGISAREIARRLGVSPSTITRRLPSLNDAGILLYEDDGERLWPFDKKKLDDK